MYISINDYTLKGAGFNCLKAGLDAVGIKAAEVGFGRDLTVMGVTPDSGMVTLDGPDAVEEYDRRLDEHGYRISALMLSNNFNADDLDKELEWVARAVRTAHSLGCSAVRIDAIMAGEREIPLQERVNKTVNALRQVVEATKDTPIPLGVENHGVCGNDPQFLEGVVQGVGDKRVGLTLDTANFYWWGLPLSQLYEIYQRFAPYVVNTHCKSVNYPEEDRERRRETGWKYGEYAAPLPDGDIDFRKVIGWLKDAGYDGPVCIEDESLGRFEGPGKVRALQRDADHLASIIR
ncbi:MAG: sugar phosphate isomerase/epimerase [Armatimonadetes bacterium]|nr:sugar phosphate isomerase/epimerase [Armatimonadota bacterium]